jgi:hypothetical protein
MAQPAPQKPELLAATLAAMRAVAENRTGTPFEAEMVAKLGAAGVKSETAKRVVGRFDRRNEGLRRSALGPFFDSPIPERGAAAATAPADAASTSAAGTGGGFGGRLGGGAVGRIGINSGWLDRLDELIPVDGTPPTYRITYQGLVAEAETNWDGFSNSDEVYAITTAVHIGDDGSNTVRTEHHPVDKTAYEDVDAREERIGPVAACWDGQNLPVSLSVVAFEHDYGDPDQYRDEIHQAVLAAVAVLIWVYPPGAAALAALELLKPLITDLINYLFDTGDDQIGEAQTEVLEQARFESLGVLEPSPYIYNFTMLGTVHPIVTNLYGHFFSTHRGSGAKYIFGFQVERDPAFVRQEGPFL